MARKLSVEQLSGRVDGSYTTTFAQNYSSSEEMMLKEQKAIEAALEDENKKVVELALEMKKSWEETSPISWISRHGLTRMGGSVLCLMTLAMGKMRSRKKMMIAKVSSLGSGLSG